MSDPYAHRKHRGKYNRPNQYETESDHSDKAYSPTPKSGSGPSDKKLAGLSNPGDKGDPQADPINPQEDRRAIYPVNYADEGMKASKKKVKQNKSLTGRDIQKDAEKLSAREDEDELSRTPAEGIIPIGTNERKM